LKREKRKGKEKVKDKEKEKDSKNKEEDEDKLDEKAKDDKACGMQLYFNYTSNKVQIKELSKKKDQARAEAGPRIYHLNKYVDCRISHFKHLTLSMVLIVYRNFYQMRLDKLRNAEIARRNRERLNNPANFPSVPSGNP
jgi:hypothetical protein